MRQVLLATGATITVTLISIATGGPKTGIVAGDITLYLRKAGGNPTIKTITVANFREVDSANLPGVYELDFTASDFDTRGEFVFVIGENGGADLEQYTETLQVGDLAASSREAYTLTVESGQPKTLAIELARDGFPVEGLTSNDLETDVFANGAVAANTIFDSLTELSLGMYAITVPAANTGTVGELLVRTRPFEDFDETFAQINGGQSSAVDVYAVEGDRNQTRIVVADNFINDEVLVSDDRGVTFNNVEFRPGAGSTVRPTGVDGNPNDRDVYVIAGFQSFGTAARAFFTEDGGQTFGEGIDISASAGTYSAIRRVALQNGGINFFLIAETGTPNTVILQGITLDGSAMIALTTFGLNNLYNDVVWHKTSNAVLVGQVSGVSDIQVYSGVNFVSATTVPNVGILLGVDMVRGGSEGWAVGVGGSVLYTTNDGVDWVDQSGNIAATNNLNGVYAVDANTAYVVGDSGEFYKTEDAGATWFVPDPVAAAAPTQSFRAVYAADSAVYTTAPFQTFAYEEGKTFSQFDSTLSRLEVTAAAPSVTPEDEIKTILEAEVARQRGEVPIPQSTAQTFATYFSENGEAKTGVTGPLITSLLFKGGTSTANTVNTTITEIDDTNLPGWYTFDLSASDTDTLGDLVVDFRAGGLSITQGEQTFPAISATRGRNVYAESATRAFIGIADGFSAPAPIQTADGGANWAQNANLGFAEYYNAEGVPGTDFVAVGAFDSGLSFEYSDDFGASWNVASDSSFTVFDAATDLVAVNSNLCYVIANSFILIWDRVASASDLTIIYTANDAGSGSEFFSGIDAIDANTIIAVGGDSTDPFIARSTNAGGAWSSIAPGTASSVALNDVDFAGNTGWVVGDGGVILVSTDGGATFTDQTSGTGANLNSVWAVDAQTAWAVGVGVILLTTDGGATWTQPAGFNALMTSREAFGVGGFGSEIWITGQDNSGAPFPFILNGEFSSLTFNPVTFRFFVSTGASVDLTPVTDALDDIQGAGFNTATDSLVQIRTNVDTVDTVVDGIDTKVTDVQGAGFDTATDSLAVLKTDLTDIQGSTFDTATDSLEAIRDSSATVDLTPVLTAIADLDADVATLTSDVAVIGASVTRLLGLSQENYRIVNQTYDANNKLTTASIRLFGSKADTDANTNPIAIYAVAATYDSQGLLVDYKVTREA